MSACVQVCLPLCVHIHSLLPEETFISCLYVSVGASALMFMHPHGPLPLMQDEAFVLCLCVYLCISL